MGFCLKNVTESPLPQTEVSSDRESRYFDCDDCREADNRRW